MVAMPAIRVPSSVARDGAIRVVDAASWHGGDLKDQKCPGVMATQACVTGEQAFTAQG